MEIIGNTNIGKLVADDYRAAAVFQKFNIDFCCNGNRPIEEACNLENLNTEEVLIALKTAVNPQENEFLKYDEWPLDLLSTYVEKKHHRYVEEQIPVLKGYLKKLIAAHGNRHNELHEILELFEATAAELTLHMKKEELMIFPQVRNMATSIKEGKGKTTLPYGSFENPISVMMKDHTDEGERFRKIRKLSNDYTAPADGCNTYKVTYKLLEEFESDLHMHIHLENNILFPKAIEMEKNN
jgi:regulator of cell morphogenesis and NO signaling